MKIYEIFIIIRCYFTIAGMPAKKSGQDVNCMKNNFKFYDSTVDSKNTSVNRKPSTQIVGRMYFVHPSNSERFSLRLLLLYRKGLDSFEKLRTVTNIIYPTYKEACCALGYLKSDKKNLRCLAEASFIASAKQMCDLCVIILLNCNPTDSRNIWERFKNNFSEDLLHNSRIKYQNPNIQFDNYHHKIAINLINDELQKNGNDLENFPNMSNILQPLMTLGLNKKITEELNYDTYELEKELEKYLPMLNSDQKLVFDTVIDRTQRKEYGI